VKTSHLPASCGGKGEEGEGEEANQRAPRSAVRLAQELEGSAGHPHFNAEDEEEGSEADHISLQREGGGEMLRAYLLL
jgi:hypothetical protein